MRVTGEALAKLIPHRGVMCLLDAILEWDEHRILCESACNADRLSALAVDGRVSPLIGIELAAQAIAAHAALLSGDSSRNGFLARVRDCAVRCDRLDKLPLLHIHAEEIATSSTALSYRFELRSEDAIVLAGTTLIALSQQPSS